MNERSTTVIVNGAAGGGRCQKRAQDALGRLRDSGMELRISFTESAGHGSELARQAYEQGVRRFISVGGDGTSYEVINGLFPRPSGDEEKLVLGILPLGTGNSFLRDFGILDFEHALERLLAGVTRKVDVIRAEHRDGMIHYLNLLGLGFTAQAGDLMNRRFKSLGPLGYIAAVLFSMLRLKHPRDPISVDGGPVDGRPAVFLSFSNSKFTGGAMMMAPNADPSDGALDLIRVGDINRIELVRAFPKIFRGTHVAHPHVEAHQVRCVEFLEPRFQPCMIDGEIVELALTRLEVLPGAMEIMA